MQAGQHIPHSSLNSQVADPTLTMGDINPAGEGKKKGGAKLRPLMGMVQRNILLIAGIASTIGGIGYLQSANAPRTFEGSFSILVEPITSQGRSTDPSVISRAQSPEGGSTIDYPTLLQVMQSPELLKKIAAQIQSQYPDVTAESLARDLKNQDFVVARVGTNILDSTRTIDVTYRGSEPERTQFILKKLAEGYLRFSLEDRRTRIGGGVEFIEDQLPALQQRVTTLETQVQNLRQRYRITDPQIENTQVREQFRDVQNERLAAQTNLKEQMTLANELKRQLKLNQQQGMAAASLSQNPRYQDLANQLSKIEAQIAVKLARYEEESPIVKTLRDQERNLKALLGQEAQQNLTQVSPGVQGSSGVLAFQDPVRIEMIRQLVQSSNQAQALQARLTEIAKTELALDQRLRDLPAIVRQYNTMQQQLDIATKTLNQFLLQRETLRVEAAQKEVPWEIISQPKLMSDMRGRPIAARGKKSSQTFMISVVAGLGLGLAAAFAREKLRNVFVTPEDLQDAVPVTFLGTIPTRKGLTSFADGLNGKLMDQFSDAFSKIYTNLRFLPGAAPRSLIAVGSAERGDGRTTVALNLAQMAASMGQRVLLVDADFVSPQLHTILNLPNQRGLTDVLRQKADVEEVIHAISGTDNLSVLTTGDTQVDSTRLFASTEMQRLADYLRAAYDLVVFDAPALNGSTDPNFLVSQTDGLLLVGGVNKTRRSMFMKTLSGLKQYNLPIVGLVANRVGKRQYSELDSVPAVDEQSHPAFFGKLKESSNAVQ
jgi:polysaccharide biosynthesis transport protein